MKKFYILLSASFAVFALASCQRVNDIEKPVEQEGSIPFELVANVTSPSSESKTTLNTSTWAVNWEDGDKIYAVTTDEAWGEAYPSDNDAAEFTYSSATEKFSTSKAIADGSHTFNFLYTNGTQKSYHRGGSTTFQLYTNQSYDVSNPVANIKAYDALAGQVTATTPTSFVDVDMSHLFTLMKVTIKNKTGASLTATKLEIEAEGAYLYGIFNVTFGATCSASYSKSGGSKIAVNIANGSIANNATIDVYLVMAPLTSYTGDITFTVTDSSANTYSRKNTISSPLTLAAGTYNSATHTLVTPDPVSGSTYTKVTSLTSGAEYLIVDTSEEVAATGVVSSNILQSSDVSIVGSTITGNATIDGYVVTITALTGDDTGYYTLEFEDGYVKYVSSTKLALNATASTDNEKWSIELDGVSGLASIKNKASDTRYIGWNNSNGWKAYAWSNVDTYPRPYLFKKD